MLWLPKKNPVNQTGLCFLLALDVAPDFRSVRLSDAGEHSFALALVSHMLYGVGDVVGCAALRTDEVALVVVDVEIAVVSVIVDGDVHVFPFVLCLS